MCLILTRRKVMATWMVHLRVADGLLKHIPGLDEAQFAIGNIAPDASVPDETLEFTSPPPEFTHYLKKQPLYDLADMDFYRAYLGDLSPHDDPQTFAFRLGYFIHLLTDNLWNQKIGHPIQERFQKRLETNSSFAFDIKRAWYALDFIYARNHPDALFWRVFVDLKYDRHDLDFLSPEAVQRRVVSIQELYQRKDPDISAMIERSYAFLTGPELDKFIDETCDRLYQIYRTLWPDPVVAIFPYTSALEMPVL
jgi:hypothetical protein